VFSALVTWEALDVGVSERFPLASIIERMEFSRRLSLFLISSASERGFDWLELLSTFSTYVHEAAVESPLTMQFWHGFSRLHFNLDFYQYVFEEYSNSVRDREKFLLSDSTRDTRKGNTPPGQALSVRSRCCTLGKISFCVIVVWESHT
jgi:hypothetical protein